MATADKVALVTGAGRGIGRAIALALGNEGYRLALLARTAPELEEVARELEMDDGTDVLVLPTDLTDAEAAAIAVRHTVERFGRLDVLVNNAGVAEGNPFGDLQFDELDRVLDVTLRGTLVMTRAALPFLLQRDQSAVVNIASIAGRRAVRGAAAYTAAKHGVVGFGEALFEEVRDRGVKVVTLLPGLVDTNAVEGDEAQRARMIAPGDVADAVLFALSTAPRVCPAEIVLRPQRSPYRS